MRLRNIIEIALLCVLVVACGDEEESLEAPPSEEPAPAEATAAATTGDQAPGTATATAEGQPADGTDPTAAEGNSVKPARLGCKAGIAPLTFPEGMRGLWVDSADPKRVLNLTATGISKAPGPRGNAVKSSVRLVAGRGIGKSVVIVGCGSLITTAMGRGGDVCRGSLELERDMLLVTMTGHRACADDMSGVFLRKGTDWKAEADKSKGQPIYAERATITAEEINRSESRCNTGRNKIDIPGDMRGVWFDAMADDGTPKSLLAVTATGISRVPGPSGEGSPASMLPLVSTIQGEKGVSIQCGDYAGFKAFENGHSCEGSLGLEGDALTVAVSGHPGCGSALSGTWKRWHGTEVKAPAAAVETPVAETPKPVEPKKPVDVVAANAGPCERVQNTVWRSTLQLEAPSYGLSRPDFAMVVKELAVSIHLVSDSNPRTRLRTMTFVAASRASDGDRCVYNVRNVTNDGPFETFETNPYSVVRQVAVTPLADGVSVSVEHGAIAAAPCRGAGCKAKRYPKSTRSRMSLSLANLNKSIWRAPEKDMQTLEDGKLTSGYASGGAPLGISAGPECEKLFGTMWMANVPVGHGGSQYESVTRNGLVIRREGIGLHQLSNALVPSSTGWTRLNSAPPTSRAGACVFKITNVAHKQTYRGSMVFDTNPWSLVSEVVVKPDGQGVKLAVTHAPPARATCRGRDCRGAKYPRKFVQLLDEWFVALNGATFTPVPAATASLDGRPAGYGYARPTAATASQAAAPPQTEPGVGDPPPKPVAVNPVAKGLRLAQEFDAAWPGMSRDNIIIAITSPVPDEILSSGTVNVRVNMNGFQTAKGEHGGNHLRVLLDNEKPRDWYDPNENALTIDGLASGQHSVRIFPVTAWGESVKGENAFAKVSFYVRTTKDAPMPIDWTRPILSYSTPVGSYKGAAGHRILLDFFLSNIKLSSVGHRVRLQLDDRDPIDLVSWSPVWLEHLPKGAHKVSLALINQRGQIVPGPFNQVDRTFTVE